MVRVVGVEPTLCFQNQILSLARLPIPPHPQSAPDGMAGEGWQDVSPAGQVWQDRRSAPPWMEQTNAHRNRATTGGCEIAMMPRGRPR